MNECITESSTLDTTRRWHALSQHELSAVGCLELDLCNFECFIEIVQQSSEICSLEPHSPDKDRSRFREQR